jgi:cysteinyl-tRNA synthetase
MDFALWKAAKPGEPSWDSQWGPGRPGWHIECTAMSMSYLGNSLDIHGGGQDLVFPHHENEKAQSEAYTGEAPFVRYWVHNGLLNMGDDKMSKSLGNNVSLNEALKRHGADALRIFFLSSHYRGPLTYSEEGVSATERAAERLSNAFRLDTGEGAEELDPEPYRERFSRAMDSDLNTPQALASMFDLAREINRSRETGAGVQRAQGVLKDLGGVLGLTFDAKQDNASQSSGAFIQLLVDTRTELRQSKQYSLADQIRSRLLELGVELEDTAQGTDWRFR